MGHKQLEALRRDAERGSQSAQFDLYECLEHGKGCAIDKKLAFAWLQKSAMQGFPAAEYALSEKLMKGDGDIVQADGSHAINWLRKAAMQEYPQACLTLARCLMDGHVAGQEDHEEAYRLYRKAAQLGVADAYTEMGEAAFWDIYQKRNSTEREQLMPLFEHLRYAAEAGDAKAQMRYGLCLKEGYVGPADIPKAINWLTKSSDAGQGMAQYALSECYEHGLGVAADKKTSFELLRKAAENDVALAQFRMGRSYMNGTHDLAEDLSQAAYWYRRAANNGDIDSKCYLGSFFLAGLGVPQNVTEGEKLLREAAEQRFPLAYFMLGMHFLEQDDLQQAVPWLQKAADAGNQNAKQILSQIE